MVADPTAQVFFCRVELSKSDGITIVIKDSKKKDQNLRSVVLDSTGITVTCKDGAVTSVVTLVLIEPSFWVTTDVTAPSLHVTVIPVGPSTTLRRF